MKYDFRRFFIFIFFMKKCNSITVSVLYRLEILHVNGFSSDLVHRHISVNLLLLEKLSPDNKL